MIDRVAPFLWIPLTVACVVWFSHARQQNSAAVGDLPSRAVPTSCGTYRNLFVAVPTIGADECQESDKKHVSACQAACREFGERAAIIKSAIAAKCEQFRTGRAPGLLEGWPSMRMACDEQWPGWHDPQHKR